MTFTNYVKNIISYCRIPYYRQLSKDFDSTDYILDVGCGKDSVLQHLNKKPSIVTGIEAHKEAFELATQSGYYNKIYFGKLQKILPKIRFYYDVVLLSDIIEHLTKKEGIRAIKQCEKLGKKIIIFTPNGFLKQEGYNGNPYQKHKSGWTEKDLQKLGYKTKIIKNWNIQSIYATKVKQ